VPGFTMWRRPSTDDQAHPTTCDDRHLMDDTVATPTALLTSGAPARTIGLICATGAAEQGRRNLGGHRDPITGRWPVPSVKSDNRLPMRYSRRTPHGANPKTHDGPVPTGRSGPGPSKTPDKEALQWKTLAALAAVR
jgi:hypothetical protein